MQSASPIRLRAAIALASVVVGCGPGIADHTRDLGSGYMYVSTGTLSKYILRASEYSIENLVADYAHDDQFVVVLRVATDFYRCPETGGFFLPTGELEYWVINKDRASISGPMAAEQFSQYRLEQSVSAELKLDETRANFFLSHPGWSTREAKVESGECWLGRIGIVPLSFTFEVQQPHPGNGLSRKPVWSIRRSFRGLG